MDGGGGFPVPFLPLLVDDRRSVDVLHVVEVLQRIEQLLHPRPFLAFKDVFGGGLHRDIGKRGREARFCESVLHGGENGGVPEPLPPTLAVSSAAPRPPRGGPLSHLFSPPPPRE